MYAERNRDPTGSKICGGLSCNHMALNEGLDGEIIGSITDNNGEIVAITDTFVYIFSPYDKLVVFA